MTGDKYKTKLDFKPPPPHPAEPEPKGLEKLEKFNNDGIVKSRK
jgi:hypothetical protein